MRVFALVWKDLEKPEVEIFGMPEVEIPEMDLYILRDSCVWIEAWFDAGNGAAQAEIQFLTVISRGF